MTTQLSVQLYSVREALAQDLLGTLQRLADLGFALVEPFDIASFDGLAAGLGSAGLTAPTAHAHFIGEVDLALFGLARDLGVDTLIDPFVAPDRWQTQDGIEGIARQLNAASRAASPFGLTVGYHNHSHELESILDGVTALEAFSRLLDPGVMLEIDTYWVAAAGVDPIALLGRLGSVVSALHLKDGPATKDDKDQVAVGSGSLPIADIINAAPTALRVIELDDSRNDLFQAVTDSYSWLVANGLGI